MIFLYAFPLIMAIVLAAYSASRPQDRRILHLLICTMAMVPCEMGIVGVLGTLARHSPQRYDAYFIISERWFGYPSFMLGRILGAHRWLYLIAQADYACILNAVLLVAAAVFMRREVREGYRLFLAAGLDIALAPLCYWFIPATGPAYAFKGLFPYVLPEHVTMIARPAYFAPPNCFPSVHMSMALVVLCFAWRWSTGRIVSVLHVALTVLATLGFGEHYLVDLLIAIPYTGIVLAISAWLMRDNAFAGRGMLPIRGAKVGGPVAF
jgi:hypothetical protein